MLFSAKMQAAAVMMVLVLWASTAMAQAEAQPGPVMAKGAISQVGNGTITVKDNTQSVTFTLGQATLVKVNGQVAQVSDLKVGMNTIVFGEQDNAAVEIRAYTPKPDSTQPAPQPSIAGTITQVGDGSITIQGKDQSTATITIDNATVVKLNTKVATAADLKVGMSAIALGEKDKPAAEIRAYSPR